MNTIKLMILFVALAAVPFSGKCVEGGKNIAFCSYYRP
jgi:hypothetical protein